MSLALLCYPDQTRVKNKEERMMHWAQALKRHRGHVQLELTLPRELQERLRKKHLTIDAQCAHRA